MDSLHRANVAMHECRFLRPIPEIPSASHTLPMAQLGEAANTSRAVLAGPAGSYTQYALTGYALACPMPTP
ncbi:MAG TPA: hypothetical protein DCQ64_01190 [Candidatus Rokubacteria bacterium]|nr:hypothetical protein [Candidatus Rokubacteria bacterium]